MTDDRTPGTEPEPGKAPPEDKRRTARELYRELDGPVDEHFKRSLAGFSRRVGERIAQQSADPQEAAQARRAALQEYDEARARRLKIIAGGAGAVLVTLSVASFIVFIAAPDAPSPAAMARTDRTTVVEVAAAKPVPDPAPPPPPSTPPPPPSLTPVTAPLATATTPMVEKASFTPATVTPSPAPAPLRRDEILEVQRLLWSFGFKAGPVDGAAGPTTRAAVVRYRQDRGLPPMGDVDRELLEQLRQDPAPKVAPPAPVAQPQRQAYAYNTASSSGGSSNPFDAMRRDFIRFQQWLRGQ